MHHKHQPYEFKFQNLLDTWLYDGGDVSDVAIVVLTMAILYTFVDLSPERSDAALSAIGWLMFVILVGAVVAAAAWLTNAWRRGRLKAEVLYADDNRSSVYTMKTSVASASTRRPSLASLKSFVRGRFGGAGRDPFDDPSAAPGGVLALGWNGQETAGGGGGGGGAVRRPWAGSAKGKMLAVGAFNEAASSRKSLGPPPEHSRVGAAGVGAGRHAAPGTMQSEAI